MVLSSTGFRQVLVPGVLMAVRCCGGWSGYSSSVAGCGGGTRVGWGTGYGYRGVRVRVQGWLGTWSPPGTSPGHAPLVHLGPSWVPPWDTPWDTWDPPGYLPGTPLWLPGQTSLASPDPSGQTSPGHPGHTVSSIPSTPGITWESPLRYI